MFGQRFPLFSLLVVFYLFLNSVIADNCFDDSPSLRSQGDNYFDLDRFAELSKHERHELDNLFESMQGDWKGSLIQTECMGYKSKYEKHNNKAEVKVKVEVKFSRSDRSYSNLTADANFRQDRITKKIRRQPAKEGNIFLFEKDGGGWKFIEKYRSFVGTGTVLIEDVYMVSASKKSMKINYKTYHSGVFVFEEQWDLARR